MYWRSSDRGGCNVCCCYSSGAGDDDDDGDDDEDVYVHMIIMSFMRVSVVYPQTKPMTGASASLIVVVCPGTIMVIVIEVDEKMAKKIVATHHHLFISF